MLYVAEELLVAETVRPVIVLKALKLVFTTEESTEVKVTVVAVLVSPYRRKLTRPLLSPLMVTPVRALELLGI